MSDSVDAIVVGAGPVGCAAAHALADRGARVVVVERMERGPAAPFAVEWLHPTAADVLLRWGLVLPEGGHVRGTGVSMHLADEGNEPVVVPYRRGMRAVSMPHAELVDALRDSVVERPGVEVLTCARVTAATPDGTVRLTRDGQETRLRADLVVAADGRSSGIRRALFGHTPQTVVSHSAGVVLEGPGLPVYESFQVASEVPGHGVAIYSIAPDAIRVVLDVPPTHPRPPALHAYLHRHFVPLMPEVLRRPLADALAAGRLTWSATGFRPRVHYGQGRLALVGDAVGHIHPILAAGTTLGIQDALSLATHGSAEAYAREHAGAGAATGRVAMALYRLLSRQEPGTAQTARMAVNQLRLSPALRDAVGDLLTGDEPGAAHLPVVTAFSTMLGIPAQDIAAAYGPDAYLLSRR
ncbi:FAD-dependent oxidoreductase [Streptomyces phaeochromogenes]|uniref:FAD-dependent oxidoreductase n=1 Tax=Streptomyces phaeochromogenes TaxID=1923 RepID=UPI002E12C819|nr:FAD-dependent monooxygenase [Streptomyces phaeochromogenes]